MLHCGICVKSLNGRSTKWNFWGMPISQLAPSRSIWTCLQPKECYILVNVKLFRSSSGHWAPTDNNPPSSRKQPSWTRWLPACWQHNIRLYKRKWKSDQHSYVFFISTPSSLLHYREISCVLNITHHKQKDDYYQIWACRKEQKITHQLMSYHGPEEMPVSKVHVHFLLELIKVALRQNPAVHVGLHLGW